MLIYVIVSSYKFPWWPRPLCLCVLIIRPFGHNFADFHRFYETRPERLREYSASRSILISLSIHAQDREYGAECLCRVAA